MFLSLVFALLAADDPLVTRVRQTAYARMDMARVMARDPALLGFVAAKNARGETAAEIQQRDARWRRGGEAALRRQLTTGACAARLREMSANDTFVLEVILMDAQGALVCSSRETSDYWQGDEPKWRKPVAERMEAFVDEPAFDESTASYAIQLSVPVAREGHTIGALCITLRVPRPAVTRG